MLAVCFQPIRSFLVKRWHITGKTSAGTFCFVNLMTFDSITYMACAQSTYNNAHFAPAAYTGNPHNTRPKQVGLRTNDTRRQTKQGLHEWGRTIGHPKAAITTARKINRWLPELQGNVGHKTSEATLPTKYTASSTSAIGKTHKGHTTIKAPRSRSGKHSPNLSLVELV